MDNDFAELMSAGLLFLQRINLLRQEALMLRRCEQSRTRNDVRKDCLAPTHQSRWSHLFANGNDEAFISAMGINKRGFDILWREFRKYYEVKYLRGKGGRPSTVTPCQALGMLFGSGLKINRSIAWRSKSDCIEDAPQSRTGFEQELATLNFGED
jgi:hypothetical protein